MRVQAVFALNDSSPFSTDVRELLAAHNVAVVPWDRLDRLRFDAAVTASENTELSAINAPVLVLPHGVGFHKALPNSRGNGRRLSGSVRPADLLGRPVQIAVTHPDQAEQLTAYVPESRGRTVVVSDPIRQRLAASRVLRQRYRTALGVDGRRLVVVGSTWGSQSLLGRWPDLLVRLLAELDMDRYQVASIMHPNIVAHGAWQLRSWWSAARAAGLIMVPSQAGWPAALLAADCLIGDHGSVSLYGASIDVPLLLAEFGDEVVPGTPMTQLGGMAARFDPTASLAAQVDAAIETHLPNRYAAAVDAAFAPEPLARSLRSVLYELIDLPVPRGVPPLLAWPPMRPAVTDPASWVVHTRIVGETVEVRRFPAAVQALVPEPAAGWWRHLATSDDEWDLRVLQSASVILRTALSTVDVAERWAVEALQQFPGCLLAAAAIADGAIVAVRDRAVVVVRNGGSGALASAAYVYAWLRADRVPPEDGALRWGNATVPVAIGPG
ncbi:hypothetical protein [Actinoplanes sp. NPDC051859]|uniref:hypothetical protein n=1 Tax=Actinoplanes sp. NPDC051859 TaxID=3363909 RepID=UPI0037A0E897